MWYTKPCNSGLTLNFFALAPKRYKRGAVRSLVHRIFNSCSTWKSFHNSMKKAKDILENNQYPSYFYEQIIHDTLEKIFLKKNRDKKTNFDEQIKDKKLFFIQYRGPETMNYVKKLLSNDVPIMPIFTSRKVKTALPSIKEPIQKHLSSNVIYKLSCSRCTSCYVGMTTRHLITRINEHFSRAGPVKEHGNNCGINVKDDCSFEILHRTNRGMVVLGVYVRYTKEKLNLHLTLKMSM